MDVNNNQNQNYPQYQTYSQPQYQFQSQMQTWYQPQIQPKVNSEVLNTTPLTVKDWFLILLIQSIPCVNLIVFCVWAFGNSEINRKRYCQASLIFIVISIVFTVILCFVLYFLLGRLLDWFVERVISAVIKEIVAYLF